MQTVCASFATILLVAYELPSQFDSYFRLFFGEQVFFNSVFQMIMEREDELKTSETVSYGALIFTAAYYQQMLLKNSV